MKISIVTATYNSVCTVRDTFESVLHQTNDDFEYIVVDGGSTDGTIGLIREYEPKFCGSMKWRSEPDKGIYDAMNKGIARATGDVIGILNSDDFYTSDYVLSTIVRQFESTPGIDAVYADVNYVDWNDTSKLRRHFSSKVFSRGLMRLGFMPAHPTFYCKKSIYEKFKLDGTKIHGFLGDPTSAYFNTTYKVAADFENLLRLIFIGKIKTHYIPEVWVTMREGGASSSGAQSHMQINRDHQRAFKENGVYSNLFLESLRYIYKVGEIIQGRLFSML